jgi:hypothetical protein
MRATRIVEHAPHNALPLSAPPRGADNHYDTMTRSPTWSIP